MNSLDIVNDKLKPVNINVQKLIKWALHDYTVKPVYNDVDKKLKSCFGVEDVSKLCHQVMQESIDSDGYLYNERGHFATVECNAEELKYIMSVVVNSAVNNWVVEDKEIAKRDTIRLKFIDLKHLIYSGTKESLNVLSLLRKHGTEGTSATSQNNG